MNSIAAARKALAVAAVELVSARDSQRQAGLTGLATAQHSHRVKTALAAYDQAKAHLDAELVLAAHGVTR